MPIATQRRAVQAKVQCYFSAPFLSYADISVFQAESVHESNKTNITILKTL